MAKHVRKWLGNFLLAAIVWSAANPASAANLPEGFSESVVASGLSQPTAMAIAPDGRIFVCEQGGNLRVIKNGTLLAAPFVSLTVDFTGERGLLGVTVDPNFSSNRFIYLYYTATTNPRRNRVVRFTASGDVAAGGETLIVELDALSNATNHNGGAIHFGPDGKLYIGVGDNSSAANAQSLNNRLGKILRLNADGTIPSDNPFSNTATGVNRAIWALGLRNPFTFGFDPRNGRMFINDVGQSTAEEINDGIAGSNYGWPACEGPCAPSNASFRDPIYTYPHGSTLLTARTLTGAAFYNSFPQFPNSFRGQFFHADFQNGWIRTLDPATNTTNLFASSIDAPVDLAVGAVGSLYYLERGAGRLMRVTYTPPPADALNISTRANVGTNDNVLIGGFIILGEENKEVVVRGIGPSLQDFGVTGALADPFLELRNSAGSLIASNNNWRDTQESAIQQRQRAPTRDAESAIVSTLAPGAYTVILRGVNNSTGVGLVEVYDTASGAEAQLANISTRALVGTGDNVAIAGTILGRSNEAVNIAFRGIGPSLTSHGIANALADPLLELYNGNGTLITSNNNWQSDASDSARLTQLGLAPQNSLESGIIETLAPGNYTAILRGNNGGVGVGLVEGYKIP